MVNMNEEKLIQEIRDIARVNKTPIHENRLKKALLKEGLENFLNSEGKLYKNKILFFIVKIRQEYKNKK